VVNTAGRLDEADTVRFEEMTADAATALLMVDVNWEQEWGVAPEHIEEAKAMNR
jgi:hypothetical protein